MEWLIILLAENNHHHASESITIPVTIRVQRHQFIYFFFPHLMDEGMHPLLLKSLQYTLRCPNYGKKDLRPYVSALPYTHSGTHISRVVCFCLYQMFLALAYTARIQSPLGRMEIKSEAYSSEKQSPFLVS